MKKISMIISLVVILGFGAMAFAGNGNGNGSPGRNGNGGENLGCNGGQGNQGTCPSQGDKCRMGPGFKQMGFGFMLGNLSEEEKELLFEARDAFREETEGIREEIHAKWEELRAAIHGDMVDVDTLLEDLYDLKYAFAQMRLNHMLEMKTQVGNFGEVITIDD